MPKVGINQYIFNFTDNLPKNIQANPNPNIYQWISSISINFVLLKFLQLLSLISIGKIEKKQSDKDHKTIYDDLS